MRPKVSRVRGEGHLRARTGEARQRTVSGTEERGPEGPVCRRPSRLSCVVTVLPPRSRGTVRLASADPGDAPLVDPGYYTSPADPDLVVRGQRQASEICGSPATGAFIGPSSFPPATDDAAYPRPYGHDRRAGGRTPATDLDTGLRQPGGGHSGTVARPPLVGPAHLPGGPRAGSRRACVARTASGFGQVIGGSRG
ncbi:GMC oxidoreductase [Streptomyces griseus]|uniref:GMC oxidoreductase n=1 Tax=Streptomyces griseus TaxID=1911 RepID=UPI0037D8F15F